MWFYFLSVNYAVDKHGIVIDHVPSNTLTTQERSQLNVVTSRIINVATVHKKNYT